MATINPYLNFMGNTEEAFNFYKTVFGTEFAALMRFSDMPGAGNLPEKDRDKIMHIALPIGNNMLMATDALECIGQNLTFCNNQHISISTASEQEADKLFKVLSEGGQIIMPLEKAFWGDYFGMLTDKFGVQWMLNYDYHNAEPAVKAENASISAAGVGV